jgi:hypothetical protein
MATKSQKQTHENRIVATKPWQQNHGNKIGNKIIATEKDP